MLPHSDKTHASSSKRPLASPRGRATLLFASCLAVVAVYLLLARSEATPSAEGIIDKGQDESSTGALQALSSFLGGHTGTLLTGSVTDREMYENPQESLAALLAEQQRLKTAQDASKCGGDEGDEERIDPLPGNITGRFHGTCRSQYPPTVPNLQVRQIWKSQNMRKLTDVTLVTHLTLDQLPMLEYQCERWSSRVAAAVYVKLPYENTGGNRDGSDDETPSDGNDGDTGDDGDNGDDDNTQHVHEALLAAEREVGDFFDRVHDAQLPCTLDVLLAYEEYTSNDPWLLLYPINALRNRALQLADAENVLVVDVDTVPNVDLSHDLHIMSLYETLNRVLGNRQVVVLPSLTVATPDADDADPLQESRWVNRSLEGIDRVRAMNEKGKIAPFQTVRSPLAQRDVDLSTWFNATMPYRLAEVHEEFEPVYLAKRATLPWYDERFRGLKLNRAIHTWHLHKTGFVFVVTPRAYVVHVPHPKGLLWLETRRSGHFKKITRMHGQALIDIDEDAYEPVTLFQCASRRSPKWTWY